MERLVQAIFPATIALLLVASAPAHAQGAPVPPPAPAPKAATPAPAKASGGGGLLAPGSRAFFAGFHLGGAFKLSGSVGQFKLGQEFGWNLNGKFGGLAVGGFLSESFGSNQTYIQLGPKAWWNFQPFKDIGFFVGPFVQLGLAIAITSYDNGFGDSQSDTHAGFTWQIGAEGRLELANRFYVMFRPFGLDFTHASGGTGIRWDFLVGGGVTF